MLKRRADETKGRRHGRRRRSTTVRLAAFAARRRLIHRDETERTLCGVALRRLLTSRAGTGMARSFRSPFACRLAACSFPSGEITNTSRRGKHREGAEGEGLSCHRRPQVRKPVGSGMPAPQRGETVRAVAEGRCDALRASPAIRSQLGRGR